MLDEEGEVTSLNNVEKALRSVGISLRDSYGLFRDLQDVLDDLGAKWDSLNSVQQAYIATSIAG